MTILEMINGVATVDPSGVAVEELCNDRVDVVLSYRDLIESVELLSSWIARRFDRQQYIGLSVDGRSWKHIVGMLAVMLAKKAFVMLDPAWPEARLTKLKSKFSSSGKQFAVLDSTMIDSCLAKNPYSWKEQAIFSERCKEIDSNLPAYCICSSGSSGEPKCIEVSHAGIPNLVANQQRDFEVTSASRFLWILSPVFDGSLSDIFVALASGSTVVIDQAYDNFNLLDIARRDCITHIDAPPSLLLAMAEQDVLEDAMPLSLRTLIVGGEQLPRKVIETFAKDLGRRVVNVYGPTEATICTSAKVYTHSSDCDSITITIGKPFYGVDYKLSDQTSMTSELLIGGTQLAIGYVGDEKMTAERFVVDGGGKRWFKTGDIVEMLPNGEWRFICRGDRQSKVNGKLVAPEEIEAAAARHGIVAAVAIDSGKISCLVENLMPAMMNQKPFVTKALKDELPEWMVPSKIVFTDQIPRLQSGKVDFQRVKVLLASSCQNACKYGSSIDKSEQVIIDMLNEMGDSSFRNADVNASLENDLHLDSIQFIMLALKIRSKYGLQLSAADFKQNDTIKKIANHIERRLHGGDSRSAADLADEALEVEQSVKASPAVKTGVLVTGAAGFLGSHVVNELVHLLKNHELVVCIARAEDHWSATSRVVDAVFNASNGAMTRDEIEQRLDCFAGDLSKDKFGLSAEEYEYLCDNIKTVFHIAGEVNDWKAASELAASNVKATTNVVKFCKIDSDASLVFASTLSVFASRSDLPLSYVCKEEPLQRVGDVVGGYAQSKWIAEKIVTDMMPTAKILRYGLLTEPVGKPMTFKRSTLSMFFRGAKYLSCLPGLPNTHMAVDLTPVDFAAKLTVASTTSSRQIFHIHAGMQVNYNSLAKRLECLDIDFADWKKMALSHVDESEDVLACYEAISREDGCKFGPFDLFQSTDIVFDRAATVELMGKAGITAPSEEQYLNQLLRVGINDPCHRTW